MAATLELTRARADELRSEAFWRESFPELSIGLGPHNGAPADPLAPAALALARERMRVDGYFQEADPGLSELSPRLGDAVKRLVSQGIPPPFIFLFDEPWASFRRLQPMLAALLGEDYRVLPDFWAWHVDPTQEQHGWQPHRDKGVVGLAPDRTPLSLTVWIPLSVADPLNGCMYMLPAERDPLYGVSDDARYRIDLQAIRALPAAPGDYLCWNQAVLHWGARSSRFADGPRLSMALEFQRGEARPFNTPLIEPGADLGFQDRLRLVAKQILQYRHMYPLGPALQALAEEIMRG